MSFLNPAILFGLAAVSIPVLIHLFNLRKVQKMEFSTLMFIKELQKTKLKRIKLKQLILLLLRCLAIIFLVLAFAKPVYKGFAGNDSGQKTVLIFLDDSFSMNVKDEKGSYFERAKKTLESILSNYKENDEVYFIPTSEVKMKTKNIFYDSFEDILDSAGKLELSDKSASMEEVVLLANELIRNSRNLTKEVYIISDFQNGNFNTEGGNASGLSNEDVNLYLVNLGEREPNNLSLDEFEIVSKIVDKNRNVKLRVKLTNHNKFNVMNKTLSLFVNGERVTEKVSDAGSLSNNEVEFDFTPKSSGSLTGYIELAQSDASEDEITDDNRIYFSLYIPEVFNVLMIADDPSSGRFIEAAFSSAESLLSDSVFNREKFVNAEQRSTISGDLSSKDLVIITGKRQFTEDEALNLKNYVENGGGVFIFPSTDIDINNYNEVLLSKFNSVRINGKQDVNGIDFTNGLGFEKLDYEHPLLSEVFKNEKLSITTDVSNIETPNIRSYYDIVRGEGANSIMSLNNKKDFLVESKLGDGKILISSVPADLTMSDYPLKPIFAPLVIRSVFYLGNNFDYKKNYTVGNINIVNTRNLGLITKIENPGREVIELDKPLVSSGYFAFPYDNYSEMAGIYTLTDSAGNEFAFAVNKSSFESNLEKMGDGDIESYFRSRGFENVGIITEAGELQFKINEARVGKDLSIYFLLIAIACVLAELFLSKRMQES